MITEGILNLLSLGFIDNCEDDNCEDDNEE